LFVIAAATLAVGCGAKAKASTDPGIPPLVIPAPPQHTMPEVEQPPLRASSGAPDGALTAEAPAVKPPPRQRPADIEPRSEPAANAAAPAAAAAGPPEPLRELRSGAIADERALQAKIDELLKSASGTLNQVDPNRLTRNGKQTFSDAKGFIETSVKMQKERRFDLALAYAEKAEKAALSLRR
jgi:hypothetical protein